LGSYFFTYFLGSYFTIEGSDFLATGSYFFYLKILFFVLYLKDIKPCLDLSSLYFYGIRGIVIYPDYLKSYKLALTSSITSSFLTS
jgi:hypothetical protein